MDTFAFHGELFEFRALVLEVLADQGFVWLSDFGAVDIQHDVYGLEVTAIRSEDEAKQIENLLQRKFPKWRYARKFYEVHNLRELGWKVMISRYPETFDDPSLPTGARGDEEKLGFARILSSVLRRLIRFRR